MEQAKKMDEVVLATRKFAESMKKGRKVIANLSPLVEATENIALTKLEFWERLIRDEYSRHLVRKPSPFWAVLSEPVEIITWLDVFSWDGYKREKALRAVSGEAPNSFFLALALRRLNDWVPAVRSAAREQIPIIVSKTDPTTVAEALCATFQHWSSWGRVEDSDKSAMLDLIRRDEVVQALKKKLTESTCGPMTLLLTQFCRTTYFDKYLVEIADRSVQPAVRAKAYRSLLEGRMVWLEGRKWEWTDIRYCIGRLRAVVGERELTVSVPMKELIERGAEDRSPRVRRISAEYFIKCPEMFGEDVYEYANKFALDPSPSVADRGEFALKKLKFNS